MRDVDLKVAIAHRAAPPTCRRISRALSTGAHVAVYAPTLLADNRYGLSIQGSDWRYEGRCPWVLVCETHAVARGVISAMRARHRASAPETWCPGCARVMRRGERVLNPPAWLAHAVTTAKTRKT